MTPQQQRLRTPTPPDDGEDLPPDITPPDAGSLVRHPDGWYWLADSGRQ